jgi:hypothetical protein
MHVEDKEIAADCRPFLAKKAAEGRANAGALIDSGGVQQAIEGSAGVFTVGALHPHFQCHSARREDRAGVQASGGGTL